MKKNEITQREARNRGRDNPLQATQIRECMYCPPEKKVFGCVLSDNTIHVCDEECTTQDGCEIIKLNLPATTGICMPCYKVNHPDLYAKLCHTKA